MEMVNFSLQDSQSQAHCKELMAIQHNGYKQ